MRSQEPSERPLRQSTAVTNLASGFTLVELLVTLVVLSLITAIMSQAIAQFLRIDDMLATRTIPAQAVAVRVDWIRQALAALQPPDASGHNAFVGTARHLVGTSGNPVTPNAAGFGSLDLSLAFDSVAGETTLQAALPGRTDPVALLRWRGDSGAFDYYDAKGNRSDTWPPPLAMPQALPTTIALQTGMDAPAVIVGSPLITNDENPSRLQIEQM